MGAAPHQAAREEHWTARHGKPIIFVILTLVAVGVYLALTIPVAVFPEADFPRIVVGVDNGVAPIDQMLVTVTRPIEEAVNSVQGLEQRAVDHQPRHRGSRSVLLLERWTCSRRWSCVNAALARVQPALPADRQGHRQPPDLRGVSDHGLQPDVGHRAADAALGAGDLRFQAAPEPA